MGVFFFGMGYSSQAAARSIHAGIDDDIPIAGTTRSGEAVPPYRIHAFDGMAPSPAVGPDLRRATHVILSIAPDDDGDPALRHHRADLDAATHLEWLCYFSTVGVYGDFGGAWVDETAATHPVNRRSRRRVEVEQQWRDYAAGRGLPLTILRLAGIYGPGRSAFDKLRNGTARRIVKPGQVFNRIHVEDIGRVTMLAAKAKLAGTFNLADDLPAPPQDVIAHAAGLLGVAPPPPVPFETADMTTMATPPTSSPRRRPSAIVSSSTTRRRTRPTSRPASSRRWRAPTASRPSSTSRRDGAKAARR
jgi:nucleoside-diphosphate-sugar epimerase